MTRLHILRAALVLQFHITRRSPGHALMLVTAPLQAVIFISLAQYSRQPQAVVNAVLAPGLIGLWLATLALAGEIIADDRRSGRFGLLVMAPAPVSLVVFGRVIIVVLFGVLTFAESWLVAALGFGKVVTIAAPGMFLAAVVVTCFAMAGTATLLAVLFTLSRGLELYQNTLNYPFYILGGVLVPVALLPGWLHPVSDLFFLSWSSDLLRAMTRGSQLNEPEYFIIITAFGLAALMAGMRLIRYVIDKFRREGTLDFS